MIKIKTLAGRFYNDPPRDEYIFRYIFHNKTKNVYR